MEIVAPRVIWFEDMKILISWQNASKHFIYIGLNGYAVQSNLVLVPYIDDPHMLCVHKSRYLCISHFVPQLDQIFEEYELDTVTWRGAVKLSVNEYTRWQLMLS